MQDSTLKILEATLRADLSITTAERNHLLKIARNPTAAAPVVERTGHQPRIYSRAEVARILGDKTTRFVDLLCRRGLLQKFTLKGNLRAIGISGQSLHVFIEGKQN